MNMIQLANRNIFVYDSETKGEYIISDLVEIMDISGKTFTYVSNNTSSPPYHFFRCKKTFFKNINEFETVINDNLFKVDYLLLEVYPIQMYLDIIDFIDITVIFLTQSQEGFPSFHTSRVPKEFNIYFFYRTTKPAYVAQLLTPSKSIKDWDGYKIKNVRTEEEWSFSSLRNRFVRDKRIDELLS